MCNAATDKQMLHYIVIQNIWFMLWGKFLFLHSDEH